MSDNQSDMIYQEVDDDLRRERLTALWRSYGKYVIAMAVGVILVVAGREAFDAWIDSREKANASVFSEARAEALIADPVAVWGDAISDLSEGYAVFARLKLAASWLEKGDWEAAISSYDAIVAQSDVAPAYRELAQLLSALVFLDQDRDIEAARGRLSALAVETSPWYHLALEQLAYAEIRLGDTAAAKTHLETLTLQPTLGFGARQRAGDLLGLIEASNSSAERVPEALPDGQSEGQS